MYVNHKNAKISFQTLISNESPNWIIIAGGEHTGKTSFIKEVCPAYKSLYCEPKLSLFYLEGLILNISSDWQLYIKDYLAQSGKQLEELKTKYDIDYINDLKTEDYNDTIRTLIRMDITNHNYEYASYLGKILYQQYSYIILDNFYKCDSESFEWLLRFSEIYLSQQGYIIAICDFDKQWESNKISTIFHGFSNLINIQYFDKEIDFFNVLKEVVFFDNNEILKQLAIELFFIYKGDAQLLFKTIKIYEPCKDTNDYDRQKRLIRIAHNLTLKSMQYSNKIDRFILEVLALSPVVLSISELSEILEIQDIIIQDILIKEYNNDLVEFETKENSSDVCYRIADTLISNLILHSVDIKSKRFILNRLWNVSKTGNLYLPLTALINLSLELADSGSEELLFDTFSNQHMTISIENQIAYINRLYSLNLETTHRFSNYNYAKIAYEFGYFETALKMLMYIKENEIHDYSYFMLLGGVQHLLLLPEAPKTFEEAANLPDITISQKLSAINREIMSLNQSSPESAFQAHQLYISTIDCYSNEKCDGLIELYRNSNNNCPMNEALKYTIKGYQLAVELNNKLEQYKCIHNISMIRLHQGLYPKPLNCRHILVEPTFELVDKFFEENPQYYHKRAYPLLDLGTYEMFEYVSTKSIEHLKKAKDYYSKAQLFAKSFYARHIAEISLLVTNTHLYKTEIQMTDCIRQKRKEIFQNYSLEVIVDYRVNRKILLSLSVSSILTHDIDEAQRYLSLVGKYISGPETVRYKNLCILCNNPSADIPEREEPTKLYYGSPDFVPWLISLGH